MSKLIVRMDDNLKAGLEELAEQYHTDMSVLVRGKVREMIKEDPEAIPDNVLFAAKLAQSKGDARPYQQVMHLPNNFAEETRNLIQTQYPPSPEVVREHYAETYKEAIDLCPDSGDNERRKAQIEHTMKIYERLHPDTDVSDIDSTKDDVVAIAVGVKMEEDMEAAKQFINSLVTDGILPESLRDEVYDEVREKSRQEWQAEWNDAVGYQMEAE